MRAIAKRPKNLYLYLAIGCFCGLVSIFVADGYMGVYDTLYITVGEYEQEVPSGNRGSGDYDAYWAAGVSYDETMFFRYRVENNLLSSYSEQVEVSLWREKERVAGLFSEPIEVDSFGEETLQWTLSAEALGGVVEEGESRQYTVRIDRGDVAQRVIVSFYNAEEPVLPKPVPVR